MPQVQYNIELRKKTTLHLGGTVPYFYSCAHEEDLFALSGLSNEIGMDIRILGGGSNLLIGDYSLENKDDILNFSVAQIQIHYENEEKFKEAFVWDDDELLPPLVKQHFATGSSDKALRIEVGAGMAMQKLLKLCAHSGATGLEGLIGVPGKLGGAIAMNAGAYNCQMDDVLESVRIYSDETGIITLTRDSFVNTYRHFTPLFQGKALNKYVICGASLVFPFVERHMVQTKIDENLMAKKSTQPIKAYTPGCVFKNPTLADGSTVSAGKLLDDAGFKGKELDGIRFSPIHANFIENYHNGSTASALNLIKKAEEEIFLATAIQLEREVKLWL